MRLSSRRSKVTWFRGADGTEVLASPPFHSLGSVSPGINIMRRLLVSDTHDRLGAVHSQERPERSARLTNSLDRSHYGPISANAVPRWLGTRAPSGPGSLSRGFLSPPSPPGFVRTGPFFKMSIP